MEGKVKADQAEIRLRGERIGILLRQADKSFLFRYDESYVTKPEAISIAICFPVEKRQFSSLHLHPFFDNLIMEGWLLNQTEKKFHIDKKNRWGLLMLIGANPIGAVSIHALDKEGGLISDDEDLDVEKTKVFSVAIASRPGLCSFCLRMIKSSDYHTVCYKKLWCTSKTTLSVQLDEEQPLLSFSRTVSELREYFWCSTQGAFCASEK
jgi:serine/threonine-protein kinase HipA